MVNEKTKWYMADSPCDVPAGNHGKFYSSSWTQTRLIEGIGHYARLNQI